MSSNGGGAPLNSGGGWLRDLIRFPSRQFVIDTEISQSETVERLHAIVEPGNVFLAGFRRTNKLFAGEVSPEGFKIMRLIYYSNGLQPVVIGRFDPRPRGTRVQVRMRLRQYASGFAALWFGTLAFIAFLSLFEAIFSSKRNQAGNWLEGMGFMSAMGAVAYLMVAASFGYEARKARGLLEEALQAMSGPRIKKATTSAPPRVPRIAKRLLLWGGALAVGIAVAGVVTPHLIAKSEPYRIADNYVRSDPIIQAELGTISGIDLKRWGNQLSNRGSEGSAKFAISVAGTRGNGVVLVSMKRHLGVWQVSTADLREASGRIITLRADTAAGTAPSR